MDRFTMNIVFVLCCVSLVQAKWQKQLGTVDFPKTLSSVTSIRRGDVISDNGHLYMAKADDLKDTLDFPDAENSNWLKLEHGTFLWPKTLDDDLNSGDIVKDAAKYFKVRSVDPMILDYFDEKAVWMTLMNPLIGDRQLGDLAVPGTHNSGTSEINEDSYLVSKNFLFDIGLLVTPATVVNWSLTHDTNLEQQLAEGYRWFDLRVADVLIYDDEDTFRWWHGLTGDAIEPGLQAFADYAASHPQEIVMCYFQHFAMPGNSFQPTRLIPNDRKEELSAIILDYLGPYMVPPEGLGNNPTVNEVLATGKNIISIMTDSFIRNLDSRYWPNIIHSSWVSRSNPEDLFTERSGKLEWYKNSYPDQMTDISGALTANEKLVVAQLLRAYGDNPNITDIIEILAPGILEIDPDEMSFEGLFMDLLYLARDGTNTNGQHVRPADAYTSGASVHYSGVNDQYRHWLARPDKFKPNVIYVDDSPSSTVVQTAIEANRGDIKREVTIAVQGSCRHGYYTWEEFTAVGGRDGLNCTEIVIRIEMPSEGLYWDTTLGTVTFPEGEFTPETDVVIMARGANQWQELYQGNIQDMIETNLDLYVRGNGPDINDIDEMPSGWGFAYISTEYNVFGEDCNTPPTSGYLHLVIWED